MTPPRFVAFLYEIKTREERKILLEASKYLLASKGTKDAGYYFPFGLTSLIFYKDFNHKVNCHLLKVEIVTIRHRYICPICMGKVSHQHVKGYQFVFW